MDMSEACNISFLDLNGVDPEEQRRVLSALECTDPNIVQLPWDIKKKTSTERITPHQEEYKEPILPPQFHQIFISGQPNEFNTMYQPHPYAVHQAPILVYAPVPTAYSRFPMPVNNNVTIVNYPQNPPQNSAINYVDCTFTNYTDGHLENTQNPQSPTVPSHSPENETVIEEVFATSPSLEKQDLPPNPTDQVEKKQFEQDGDNQENGVPNVPVHQQNGSTPKVSSVWKTPKVWSNIYNSNSPVVVNGDSMNGNTKSNYVQDVREPNNNNTNGIMCPIRHAKKDTFIDPICYRMAEYLMSHTVDGRTISLQPRGLINRSNYCYINSILQALLACPPVYNLLNGLAKQNTTTDKVKPTPIIDGMCLLIKEFQHLPAGQRVNRRNDKSNKKEQNSVNIDHDLPFEPFWMYKLLNGIRSDSFLVEGRQEDAEEFLGCLLNGMNDEMLELIKLIKGDIQIAHKSEPEESEKDSWHVMGPKNRGGITRQTEFAKTPISDIFGGFLKSRIQRCGDLSTYNIQPFFTLPLNIEKVKTVKEALEALVTKNQLEGITSSKTHEEVEAWQQVTIEELPVILILHLKCFDFKPEGCTKIVKALEFPIDLKIDAKLLSSKPTTSKEKQYKLFAVVYHDGKETTKGHYITDAFHVGYSNWLRYDDSSIKTVSEEQVLKPQGTRVPYLLFYRRSDTIRSK